LPETENANPSHIALEQRVGRLRGGVRDEDNLRCTDGTQFEQPPESLGHPERHALSRAVGRGYPDLPEHCAIGARQSHGVGERAPDVDPNTY
jgi:hypothetical protein